jgi:hypothetical protein
LLRSQVANSKESNYSTPSSLGPSEQHSVSQQPEPIPAVNPNVAIDTSNSVVELFATSTSELSASLFQDVSSHKIANMVAEEQLNTFRQVFILVFPFVYIPNTMSSLELRRQKPFLWLVIMALTSKMVSQQFAIEETIWTIITQRIIREHAVNIDLLLGIVCFASWSHYFKKDKPFMTMLSQIAVTLTLELGLQKDSFRQGRSSASPEKSVEQNARTMEERRTILAVYHLTST